MNAIILHGTTDDKEYYDPSAPSLSNAHWLPWLQNQLLIKDIPAATPEIPEAFAPEWDVWVKEVERFEIGPETILVGHSCGGGFWVRYLSEHPDLKVGKVVLVAPWLDPEDSKRNDFFKFNLRPDIAAQTDGLTIFHSDNDSPGVQKSVARLRETLEDYEYREFHKYGHFCYEDMGTTAFPELLETLLK